MSKKRYEVSLAATVDDMIFINLSGFGASRSLLAWLAVDFRHRASSMLKGLGVAFVSILIPQLLDCIFMTSSPSIFAYSIEHHA